MRLSVFAAAAAMAVFTVGCASAIAQTGPRTVALKGPGGTDVGSATLTASPTGVLLKLDVKGLTPGWHGMHLHEKGDCSAADFTSAGAHINHPTAKKPHGLLNDAGPDGGDLPNIYVAADGTGHAEAFTSLVKLTEMTDADGSAIVLHANPDDHKAQPIGGAGGRVGCGVVK
jgi:superoxide dismutase, Cu-Zn family